jgi:prepilin-type N-terminal cleavage/methylation domain-containing protein
MVQRWKKQAGFTLTEMMVVVVILGLLAAASLSTLTKDTTASKGRNFAREIAQTLQSSRFQAMSERTNIHVQFYRTRVDVIREDPPGTYTLLNTLRSPSPDGVVTVAIWDAMATAATPPTGQSTNLTVPPGNPSPPNDPNDIIFTPLGGTLNQISWTVYIRNEHLPSTHPDAAFALNITGLTGFVTTRTQVPLP